MAFCFDSLQVQTNVFLACETACVKILIYQTSFSIKSNYFNNCALPFLLNRISTAVTALIDAKNRIVEANFFAKGWLSRCEINCSYAYAPKTGSRPRPLISFFGIMWFCFLYYLAAVTK